MSKQKRRYEDEIEEQSPPRKKHKKSSKDGHDSKHKHKEKHTHKDKKSKRKDNDSHNGSSKHDKKHKSKHKDKGKDKAKHKSKHKDKHKNKDKWASNDNENRETSLPYSAEKIDKSHYYQKLTEFRKWLLDKKHNYLDDLTTKEAKKLFSKKFVKKWNNGELSKEYYSGIHPQSLEDGQRTRYHWDFEKNMTDKSKWELATARDTVDTNTNDFNATEQIASQWKAKYEKKQEKHNNNDDKDGKKDRNSRNKNNKNNYNNNKPKRELTNLEKEIYGNDNESTMKRENDRQRLKYERKQWNKHNEMVNEELVPTKEGFARRVEKRQLNHWQNDKNNNDFDDSGTMSHFENNSNYDTNFSQKMKNMQQRQAQKEMAKEERLSQYKAKESQIMSHFQDILNKKNQRPS